MKYSQAKTRGYQYCCTRCNVLIIEGKQNDALINKLPICETCDKEDRDFIAARGKEKFKIDEKEKARKSLIYQKRKARENASQK